MRGDAAMAPENYHTDDDYDLSGVEVVDEAEGVGE